MKNLNFCPFCRPKKKHKGFFRVVVGFTNQPTKIKIFHFEKKGKRFMFELECFEKFIIILIFETRKNIIIK